MELRHCKVMDLLTDKSEVGSSALRDLVRAAVDTNDDTTVNCVFVFELNHVSRASSLIGNVMHANRWLGIWC